jgi:hypothetical protein
VPDWVAYGDGCYFYSGNPLSFSDAEAMCQSKVPDGHLASVTSLEEAEFLGFLQVQSGLNTKDAWIGGISMAGEIDYRNDFQWRWLDGTLYNDDTVLSIWAPEEPNGVLGGDGLIYGGNCINIVDRSKPTKPVVWNDGDCNIKRRSFCKVYFPNVVKQTSTQTTTQPVIVDTPSPTLVAFDDDDDFDDAPWIDDDDYEESPFDDDYITTAPTTDSSSSTEDPQIACSEMGVPDWVPYRKECYIYIPEKLNFGDAQARCASEFPNAVMATAPNYAVNAFLGDLQAASGLTTHAAWLGGKSDELANNATHPFSWVDGTTFEPQQTQFLWAANEPSNIFNDAGNINGEMCIAIFRRYGDAHKAAPEWNDSPCHLPNRFFCKVALPTTTTSSVTTTTTSTRTTRTTSTTVTTLTKPTTPTTTSTVTTVTITTVTTHTTTTTSVTTQTSSTTTISTTSTTATTTTTQIGVEKEKRAIS